VNAQSWSFFSVLGVGATCVLMPKWSTSRFWEVVERQRVTHISLMPFCIPALMSPDRPAHTELRAGVFGAIMPDWDRQFGLSVYAAYGMTETVTHAVNVKTGDMVVQGPGGNVFYRERDKDLLKVGGENVSAKEVEEAVAGVAGVAQVAVVGKEHEWLNQVVVAFVIKASGAPDDATLESQVIETCKGRLADFKVPRAVYFVEQFPTGTLDKILKNKLREMADAHPPVK
jgi:acyl-coenzyme A synthetase/AMP-(fatty) acid ligase